MRNRLAASIKTLVPSLHDPAQHGGVMGRRTISALRLEGGQSRSRETSARRRFLLIAMVLSVAVHVAAALLIVLLPRVLPREARPQEMGTVELLMVEKKGAEPSAAGPKQDSPPAPPQPPKQEVAAKPETPKPEPQAVPPPPSLAAPPVADAAGEPVPPPAVATSKPQEAKAEAKPDAPPPSPPAPPPAPPPKAAEAPVFDLAGTESESNAEALGGHILPASPDNRFRNRPPIYPDEAAIRGEHGSVLLLIHVSEAGIASGVDVVESSGVASLDQAAVTAVRKWRFHPALREGEAVPFDMPFRFVFEAN
jgi:protein TonB